MERDILKCFFYENKSFFNRTSASLRVAPKKILIWKIWVRKVKFVFLYEPQKSLTVLSLKLIFHKRKLCTMKEKQQYRSVVTSKRRGNFHCETQYSKQNNISHGQRLHQNETGNSEKLFLLVARHRFCGNVALPC